MKHATLQKWCCFNNTGGGGVVFSKNTKRCTYSLKILRPKHLMQNTQSQVKNGSSITELALELRTVEQLVFL
jgi:hypothetical protein